MNWKNAFKKGLKVSGVMLLLAIPFIAGICAKEEAVSGFETAIGWLAMAESVCLSAYIVYKHFNKEV